MTFKEQLIAGLKALGWTQDLTATTGKYVVFTNPSKKNKLFVGRNGALRSGECVSRSYSIGDPSYQSGKYKAVLSAATTDKDQVLQQHLRRMKSNRLWTVFIPAQTTPGLGTVPPQEVWHTGSSLMWRKSDGTVGRSGHRYSWHEDFNNAMARPGRERD